MIMCEYYNHQKPNVPYKQVLGILFKTNTTPFHFATVVSHSWDNRKEFIIIYPNYLYIQYKFTVR